MFYLFFIGLSDEIRETVFDVFAVFICGMFLETVGEAIVSNTIER